MGRSWKKARWTEVCQNLEGFLIGLNYQSTFCCSILFSKVGLISPSYVGCYRKILRYLLGNWGVVSHSCCFFDGLRATLTHPANQEPKHALPGTCGPTWLLCRRSAGDMMTWNSGKGSVVSFKVPFPHGNSRIPPPTPPFQAIWPYQVVTNHRCPLLSAWWWQVVRSNYPCVLDSTLVGLKICLYHIWISYVHIPKYTQLTVCMRTYRNIEVTA